jgi:23S rRNA (uracil1939-C5)-methyltransferase
MEICRHFGDCGGCASQNVPYAEQLRAKEEAIRRIVAPFSPARFHPIKPSPDIFYYRNKMEFAFGQDAAGKTILGLRRRNHFDQIVDLAECRLLSPEAPVILETARAWAERNRLTPYNLKSHRGFLRYLVVREGKNTGQRMIHLLTNAGELPADSLVEAFQKSGVRADTVLWSVNAGLSDVARADKTTVLSGSGVIEDSLDEKKFRISPSAFFQTNTRGAEVLYRTIAGFLGQADTLLDIYCGSGAIGLFCADKARRVYGLEINASAIEDARLNARLQGAAHADFIAQDAAIFDPQSELGRLWGHPGAAAVIDPPRAGLASKLRRRLLEQPLKRWIYVSCNPKALAADLPILRDAYDITDAQPVDLFPHTEHVETVVTLRGK